MYAFYSSGSVQQAQILEVDIGTPLDSPIQMPPYPVTPSVAQFFVGTDTLSRPTTADTEGGGVVRTTSGEGELSVENRRLRSVIADMRQEMERLQQQQGGVRDNAMRVEQLELERRELAAKLAKAEAHVSLVHATALLLSAIYFRAWVWSWRAEFGARLRCRARYSYFAPGPPNLKLAKGFIVSSYDGCADFGATKPLGTDN